MPWCVSWCVRKTDVPHWVVTLCHYRADKNMNQNHILNLLKYFSVAYQRRLKKAMLIIVAWSYAEADCDKFYSHLLLLSLQMIIGLSCSSLSVIFRHLKKCQNIKTGREGLYFYLTHLDKFFSSFELPRGGDRCFKPS